MLLSDFSIRRPVFAAVISLILAVFGFISYSRLAVREYPDIDPPVVSVETNYPGAAANVVETRITEVVEERISGIEGVRSISSVSRDGVSEITIEFNLDRNIDAAANDVRDRVSRVLDNLPDEADPPEVFKVDANSDVILWLNLASENMNRLELTDYADRYLVDRFSVLPGVARVRIGGSRRYAMRIWLDREAMAARGIAVTDVENALRTENLELPAGRVESKEIEFTVRIARQYNDARDFENLVVRRGTDGYLVRLRDVARVELGAEDYRSLLRGNRQAMVGLGFIRQSKANTLEVAQAVKAEAERVRESLPEGTQLYDSYDSSVFIERSISEVFFTLFLTALLVIIVMYLFLGNLRATLVPAITVPVSLTASFTLLYALDFSVNLLTLLALILAIGLVVDDSIVVLENIERRMKQLGEPPLLAAYRGAREVGFAVIATTLVLVAVFVPIAFMRGNTGRLFSEFALALAGAVCFSSLIALTLSPMLCSKILKNTEASGIAKRLTDLLDRLTERYGNSLASFVQRPFIAVIGTLGFVVLTGVLYAVVVKEYVPKEDRGAFFVIGSGPEGATFEKSFRMMERAEDTLMPLHDKTGEANRVLMIIPRGFNSASGVNSFFGIIVLKDWGERSRSAQEIMDAVNKELGTFPGYRTFTISRSGLGGGTGRPVQFVIGGGSYEELTRWRDRILERARENPGLVGMDSDYKETKPQLEVRVNRDRAADLGVSMQEIGRTLETMLGFRRVTTFLDRGEEYDVMLEGMDPQKDSPDEIGGIYVRSDTTGRLVPLSGLISLKEFADSPERNRFNRLRAITIEAGLSEDYTLGEALEYMERITREELGQDPKIDYKGQSREYQEASGELLITFGMSLIIVYLVLAAQFESFVHPVVILTTVPLAVGGALLGLVVFQSSLNVYSQIGVSMLIGLAAKNGILIVEFANQLRDQGKEFSAALLEAAQLRLRPVLMTSVSTVAGAVPLILATGAGKESRFTIGVVIFAGVLVATLLTLYLVPAFYGIFGRWTGSPMETTHRLREQEQRFGGQ